MRSRTDRINRIGRPENVELPLLRMDKPSIGGSVNTAIIDTLAKGSVEAFNLGLQVERERITAILRGHITVCNYKAVNEEECDVCAWADSTIAQINQQ